MGLNGRGGDGSYHSTYDNPTWFKKYIDPTFSHSVLASQMTGVALLRLIATAPALAPTFGLQISHGQQLVDIGHSIILWGPGLVEPQRTEDV